MAESVIIDLSLNASDYSRKAEEAIKSIQELKKQQKELKESGQEATVQFEQNKQKLQLLSRELKANTTLSQNYGDSIVGLRANISILNAQWAQMSQAERETTAQGKALAQNMLDITNKLKEQEEGVGDNRRSVGAYKDAIVEAAGELKSFGGETVQRAFAGFKQFEQGITEAGDTIKAFIQTNKEAKEAQQALQTAQRISTEATKAQTEAEKVATQIGFQFSKGKATRVQVEEAEAAVVAATTVATEAQTEAIAAATIAQNANTAAVGLGTTALRLFKIALAATGIGAVIILIGGLIDYLRKFDPLMDKIEQGLSAVGAAFEVVEYTVVSFFRNIRNLGDLFAKLGNFLLNPIKSFKDLGREMREAAKAASELTRAQQDLEDQQKIQEIANARAQQQIAQLMLQARNRTLSEKERVALLKQAGEIDKQNFEQRKKIADEELRIAQQDIINVAGMKDEKDLEKLKKRGIEYAFELKNRGRVTDEQVDKLKDAEIKRTAILQESTQRQEKIQNQQDALAEKAAAAQEKRAQAAKEADDERLESLQRTNEIILTERQRELEAVNHEIDTKIQKYKAYGKTTIALEQERAARIKAIRDKFMEQDLENVQVNKDKIKQIQINAIKDQAAREIAQIQFNNNQRLSEQDKVIAGLLEREAKKEEGVTALLASAQELRQAMQMDGERQLSDKMQEIRNSRDEQETEFLQMQLERDQEYYQARQELRDAELNALSAGTDFLRSIFGEQSEVFKAAFLIQKSVALATIVLRTQEALAANRKAQAEAQASVAGIPLVGAALAAGIAAVYSAQRTKIILEGIASSAVVVGSSVQGLADGGLHYDSDGKGGLLRGPGSGRSDSMNAKLSNGESVINAESTRRFLPILSAINQAGGGRPLLPVSVPNSTFPYFASGGMYQGAAANYGNADGINYDAIGKAVADNVKGIQILTDVRDVTSAQQRRDAAANNRII